MGVFSIEEIELIARPVAEQYGVQAIYLFGSYARGTATEESDLDFLVIGGAGFRPALVYALGEDLRETFQKDIDIFEIHEVDVESELYKEVMKEGKMIYLQVAVGDFPGGTCH